MHALASSRLWVLVLSCSLSASIRLFCASVELVVLFRACGGGSGSAYMGIRVLRLSMHPVESFRVLIPRVFFLRNFDS